MSENNNYDGLKLPLKDSFLMVCRTDARFGGIYSMLDDNGTTVGEKIPGEKIKQAKSLIEAGQHGTAWGILSRSY